MSTRLVVVTFCGGARVAGSSGLSLGFVADFDPEVAGTACVARGFARMGTMLAS
jgi:hypothetical protein